MIPITKIWDKFVRGLGFREVCDHCGAIGWGNSVGCNKMWEDWAIYSEDTTDWGDEDE